MSNKAPSFGYKIVKTIIRWCYPKLHCEGTENLLSEPMLIIGNHAQINGPIGCELYSPVPRRTWCAAEMMDRKQVAAYAYRDFWSQKPKWTRGPYMLLAHLITPLSVLIFNNAETIPVYRDNRVLSTFRATVNTLAEGKSVVIFPEHDERHNHIVDDFQNRFVDAAKLYYRKTGKTVSFVPLYVAPKLKKLIYGKPVPFDPEAPIEEERIRIAGAMMDGITALADAQPLHTVIPYRPIAKRLYPKNHPGKGAEE